MKAYITVILCLILCDTYAQKISANDVPQKVKEAFSKQYGWKDVQWSKEDGNFEAEYKQERRNISVVLDPSGTVIEVETEIWKKELPIAILNALKKDYQDYEYEEFAKIEGNGSVTYEVEVEKRKESFDLIFSSDGTLIRKEMDDEREDEKK